MPLIRRVTLSLLLVGLAAFVATLPAPVAAALACSATGGAPTPWSKLDELPSGAIGPDASPIGGRAPQQSLHELINDAIVNRPPDPCDSVDRSASNGEPASLPLVGTGQAAGNPVDLITGNKYERHIDIVLPDIDSGLEAALVRALGNDARRVADAVWQPFEPLRMVFSRHYNSRFAHAGILGPGWRHSFETALARFVKPSSSSSGKQHIELQVVQADARRIVFRSPAVRAISAAPLVLRSTSPQDGELIEDLARTLPWTWKWPDGRLLVFDRDGQLASITAPDGDRIDIRRDATGRPTVIRDSADRHLRLEYLGRRLHAILLPEGGALHYRYDEHGVLKTVHYPDGRKLQYRYAEASSFHLLTGIERPDGTVSEYQYDEQQRVVASRPTGVDAPRPIQLAYQLPETRKDAGLTTVVEDGRISRWRWRLDDDGNGRLIAVEGEPCSSCPRLATADSGDVPRNSDGRSPDPAHRPSIRVAFDGRSLPAELSATGRAVHSDGSSDIHLRVRWIRHQDGPAAGKLKAVERVGRDGTIRRTDLKYDDRRRFVGADYAGAMLHRIQRDRLGRVIAERRPDRSERIVEHDDNGRLVSLQLRGETTRVAWGEDGRPGRLEWPSGEVWTLFWTPAGVWVESNQGWQLAGLPRREDDSAEEAVPAFSTVGSAGLQLATSLPSERRMLAGDRDGIRTAYTSDAFGRLIEERSPTIGYRRYLHDDFGQTVAIDGPLGPIERRRFDEAGRLVEREERDPSGAVVTRLLWDEGLLVGVDHPQQDTRIAHDDQGRVTAIAHRVLGKWQAWEVEHDSDGRIIKQGLPGGSALEHVFDAAGRRAGLRFRAPDGSVRTIIDRVRFEMGRPLAWRLGNGVGFERVADQQGLLRRLRWIDPPERSLGATTSGLPHWRYRWNRDGRLVEIAGEEDVRRFAWNDSGRLIIQERELLGATDISEGGDRKGFNAGAGDSEKGDAPRASYFVWSPGGDLLASKDEAGHSSPRPRAGPIRAGWSPRVSRFHLDGDAMGRTERVNGLTLRYGAQQRISQVERDGSLVAAYAYNAAGERVTKEVAGQVTGFLYRNRRLAAETDARGEVRRHYLYWMGEVAAIVDLASHPSNRSPSDELATTAGTSPVQVRWIHGDHLGTPHAATDETGQVVWRGRYEPFGRLIDEEHPLPFSRTSTFVQPLRFSGQYHDPETGLHDNYRRTYDPAAARYLEPDPLGLAGGPNRYAYVDGNPLMGTDPLGLILFAFDGTMNSDPPPGNDDISNVRKFYRLSREVHKWYMAGVGRTDSRSGIEGGNWDALTASTARRRVNFMLNDLSRYLDGASPSTWIPIDVIGYSRGAAMARDFVNKASTLVREREDLLENNICVEFRFLGLWDTVAQFGLDGRLDHDWTLDVPESVQHTYHAIAMNEHRRLFPLQRIRPRPSITEVGFVGSHTDVGGANAEGDLSDISLVWMLTQASRHGVELKPIPSEYLMIDAPILHKREILNHDRRVET